MSALTSVPLPVLETCLYVDDLPRAVAWYQRVLRLVVAQHDERFAALLLTPQQRLLLFLRQSHPHEQHTPLGLIPPHQSTGSHHLALAITPTALADWEAHLQHEAVPLESRLDWPGGSVSLFFRDPDGNLLELAPPGIW